jgi:predicted transcriptional regulator
MQSTTVRISADKLEQLRQLTAQTGESMPAILEKAIEQY